MMVCDRNVHMKKVLGIIVLSLLLNVNAFSKTTNLICKLDKEDKSFIVLLDDENKNATWNDLNVQARFSAAAVKFIVARIEQSKGIYVVMDYEISRVNLDLIQTITLTVPATSEIDDKIISADMGKCKLGDKILTQF